MEGRSGSNDHLPEVNQAAFSAQHPYEDFEFYERPPAQVPEYQHYIESPAPSQSGASPRETTESTSSPPVVDHIQAEPDRLAKNRPLSPSSTAQYSEVNSPGLQSVDEREGEKEVIKNLAYFVNAAGSQPEEATPHRKGRICGIPKTWFFALAALVLIAIIAIAVACGVVFGTRHSPSATSTPTPSPTSTPTSAPTPTGNPDITVGGALDPLYYSQTGAWNGSGIAIASANFGLDSSIYVYFQHYTGEIRSFIQEADGSWTDSIAIVSSGARNATPLSAVAYVVNEVATWHIFYIDQDSYVRQRTSSNGSAYQTNIWQEGPLNSLNLQANNADMIGLQACYWGNFYGDTDFTSSNGLETFNGGFNATLSNLTTNPTGMHLWYADSDTSFQQYSWYTGLTQWVNDNQTWQNMNGHAGVGCQTWESGTTQYVFFVDSENTVEIWWKDSNINNTTPKHPTNRWVNSSVSIPGVHPSSSLGYTNYLALQYGDDTIRGFNISWAAENTTFAPAKDGGPGYDNWTIPNVVALPGTHLSITALADQSGGSHLTIFFQENGTDIVQFARDDTAGAFTNSEVPVNQ